MTNVDTGDIGGLPGVEYQIPDQIVAHVDMDCFYASCERARHPELRGEPVVIGMGYEEGDMSGAVATASYEAREHGVESAQPIDSALENLPRRADTEHPESEVCGYYRPVDMEYYETISQDVMELLDDTVDTVRRVSIDEAYLDLTAVTDWEAVATFVHDLRDEITEEIGVPASIGVAPTMSAAKIASDYDKPDGLIVVTPSQLQSFLADLDIDDLHGIGPVTAKKLREHDITTVGDLASTEIPQLEREFGERGREIGLRARGYDDRSVEPRDRAKSISNETSIPETTDMSVKQERIRALAEQVTGRARAKGALYRTVGIKVVEPPFDVNTREQSLPAPVDDPDLVEEIALEQLTEFRESTVRKLGVRVSNLSFGASQSTLTKWHTETDDESTAELTPVDNPYRGKNPEKDSSSENQQRRLDAFEERGH